jgi:hypothetical protein
MDPTELKELISTKTVKVFLHDCDEFTDVGENVAFAVGSA